MKVVRMTYYAKSWCSRKLIEAFKAYPEYGLPDPPHGWRIYSESTFSPWDVVIHEVDFESLEECDAFLKELWAAPRIREYLDLHSDLIDRGGGAEFWNVEHFG